MRRTRTRTRTRKLNDVITQCIQLVLSGVIRSRAGLQTAVCRGLSVRQQNCYPRAVALNCISCLAELAKSSVRACPALFTSSACRKRGRVIMWWWVLPFTLQAVLVTCQLYGLVVCADLTADYINAYDAAARLNALVKPELALLSVQVSVLAISQRPLLLLCCGVLLFLKARRFRNHVAEISAADVVQRLSQENRLRYYFLAAYALLFVAFIVLLLAEALELAPAPQVRVSVGSVRPDSERNA